MVSRRLRADVILLLMWSLTGCTHHDDGFARLQDRQAKCEAILAKDQTNYPAMHDLAMIYSTLYVRDVQTGASSAQACKEKALTMVHGALKQAPLGGRADLGMALERLGYNQEALSVYEKFLEDAQHIPVPVPPLASNAPPVMEREAEANWRGLITIVQTHVDLLKKSLGTS